MKLFSGSQVRDWDQYTIEYEPVPSINLMERAASKCVKWIEQNVQTPGEFHVFCGKGNNGGDGLAIARMLAGLSKPVTVHILEFGHKGTEDFQVNLSRLHHYPEVNIRFIQSEAHFQVFKDSDIIIDALFGTGLNRALEGVTAKLVDHINGSGCMVIAIDIPSGLFTDRTSPGYSIIQATHTLVFQTYKLAFLMAENHRFIGNPHILDIGLHRDFYDRTESRYELVDQDMAQALFIPRNRFGHKGNFGHSLLIAGSYGKIGAAALSALACLRSGTGLLTCHIPKCGYDIIQTLAPEAMVVTDFNSSFSTAVNDDLSRYNAIGIGPGIGTASETRSMIKDILDRNKRPMVLDADALNIIASQKEMLNAIAPGSIITPHPKEFERLFGTTGNDFERIELATAKAIEHRLCIILKGHHTFIATPAGNTYFNSTGNAGMATGGSGDVLTGILTSLLAQGYQPEAASVLGVFLHGVAGDMAAERNTMEAMVAGDICNHLKDAFFILTTG